MVPLPVSLRRHWFHSAAKAIEPLRSTMTATSKVVWELVAVHVGRISNVDPNVGKNGCNAVPEPPANEFVVNRTAFPFAAGVNV